jgi:hypothetical protein
MRNTEMLAAILKNEPDCNLPLLATPPHEKELLQRCLWRKAGTGFGRCF